MKISHISATTMLLIGLISSGLTGCGQKPGNGAPPSAGGPGGGMPPAEVEFITTATGSATLTQDLPARIEAWRTAQVRARVEGIVEKRLFTEGSDVKAGATLFSIDPRTYAAAYQAAKADVEAARLVVSRYKPLLEIKAVSQQEYDTADARYKQTQATLARASLDMENTRVPAPISGRIGRASVTEGALVGRGETAPLATIEQIDPIYVNFTQPGSELLRLQAALKAGTLKHAASTKVELLLEDGSKYPLSGKILFSDLAVNPSTGAISVRAQFPNPDRMLLPGMFARVRFPSAIAENVVRIPQSAVQTGPQGQFVLLVVDENKTKPQPIKTGSMADGDFIVTEGLKGGERIIVSGFQKMRPGAPFKVIPWQAPGTVKPAAASKRLNDKKAG
ncbi:MAG: efflux RND transporter periplasmic adaptor subunit [Rugosibacter sp.]|jgi:membrane fusion protein (multidrug efflux system)|nr:efflux RND transporter periplasmic adaptor subunit [Rugosibacter sp.]